MFRACQRMLPDFSFDSVTVNKFERASQCQPHLDAKSLGESYMCFFGGLPWRSARA